MAPTGAPWTGPLFSGQNPRQAKKKGDPFGIALNKEQLAKLQGSVSGSNHNPGNDLLSHSVDATVSSALEVLTSEFGMGSGVAPPL
jgi:hypothetical protein